MTVSPMHSIHQSNAQAVVPTFGTNQMHGVYMPLPAVQSGWLHSRELVLPWDADRIIAHVGPGCWFSHYCRTAVGAEAGVMKVQPWSFAGFWPTGGFIELLMRHANPLEDNPRGTLCVYAESPARAEALMAELVASFQRTDATGSGPRIGILNCSGNELAVERVNITAEQIVPRDRVDLFYGLGMTAWVDEWIRRFDVRRYGLTILTGAPGTGKTTLMRSIAHWLSESHMFYFMPASRFTTIESGRIVSFWADENRNSKLRKVLILEDAESVLLRRDGCDREKVSTLLNLTDGMLGDALGLHVVCTVNCEVGDLDPAVLRPGRLIAFRDFDLLTKTEASRLAEALGLPAPTSERVSLADLFNPSGPTKITPTVRGKTMGFHTVLQT